MGAGNLVLAYGTPENREVLAGTGLLFDSEAQLTSLLGDVVGSPDGGLFGALARGCARPRGLGLLLGRGDGRLSRACGPRWAPERRSEAIRVDMQAADGLQGPGSTGPRPPVCVAALPVGVGSG